MGAQRARKPTKFKPNFDSPSKKSDEKEEASEADEETTEELQGQSWQNGFSNLALSDIVISQTAWIHMEIFLFYKNNIWRYILDTVLAQLKPALDYKPLLNTNQKY